MSTATLPRLKFTHIADSLASTRVTLAKDAAAKLGYTRLARAISAPHNAEEIWADYGMKGLGGVGGQKTRVMGRGNAIERLNCEAG